MSQSFGSWLRQKRGSSDLRTFAALTGIDSGTVSRIESEKEEILIATAYSICQGLTLTATDFFLEWQGRVLANINQQEIVGEQSVFTKTDAQNWLYRVATGDRRCQELLVAAFNHIIRYIPQVKYPMMTLADIEHMLNHSDHTCLKIDPPLQEPVPGIIEGIYQKRGLLLLSELGAYVRRLRKKQQLSLENVAEQCALSASVLSRIENGKREHLKLCELILLDDFLQSNGKILLLYWWETAQRIELEREWKRSGIPDCVSAKHHLVAVMISIGRWLQLIYRNDSIWLQVIRHEIGILPPLIRVDHGGEEHDR